MPIPFQSSTHACSAWRDQTHTGRRSMRTGLGPANSDAREHASHRAGSVDIRNRLSGERIEGTRQRGMTAFLQSTVLGKRQRCKIVVAKNPEWTSGHQCCPPGAAQIMQQGSARRPRYRLGPRPLSTFPSRSAASSPRRPRQPSRSQRASSESSADLPPVHRSACLGWV